jgi:hypothetical protein
MGYALTAQSLGSENRLFAGTGGISRNNRLQGLRPAFHDTESGQVAISCFADGRPSPIHLLEGVPVDWVTVRSACGGVLAVKASVVAGFIRGRRFYTRAQAACLAECSGEAYLAADS